MNIENMLGSDTKKQDTLMMIDHFNRLAVTVMFKYFIEREPEGKEIFNETMMLFRKGITDKVAAENQAIKSTPGLKTLSSLFGEDVDKQRKDYMETFSEVVKVLEESYNIT